MPQDLYIPSTQLMIMYFQKITYKDSEKSVIAQGWHLEMVESGGYGFIYDPTALNLFLIPFFKRFLNIN